MPDDPPPGDRRWIRGQRDFPSNSATLIAQQFLCQWRRSRVKEDLEYRVPYLVRLIEDDGGTDEIECVPEMRLTLPIRVGQMFRDRGVLNRVLF